MAAASWARRSGVRLSFLFTFFAALGPVTAAGCVRVIGVKRRFLSSVRPDFPFFLGTPAFAAAPSFCFSFASFFAPFCRRASNCRIFLLRFLGFIRINSASGRRAWRIGFRVNDGTSPMSRHLLKPDGVADMAIGLAGGVLRSSPKLPDQVRNGAWQLMAALNLGQPDSHELRESATEWSHKRVCRACGGQSSPARIPRGMVR